jgi:hypothetical protein
MKLKYFAEVIVETVRAVVDSGKLDTIVNLPPYFRHKKVEIIIQLIPDDNLFTSESFGMWEDRQELNNKI